MFFKKLSVLSCVLLSSHMVWASSAPDPIEALAHQTLEWVNGKNYNERKGLAGKLALTMAAVSGAGVASAATSGASTSTGIDWYAGNTVVSTTNISVATQQVGLMAALGGGAATLYPILGLGASAAAVYGLYKLGEEAVDRKACYLSCGFDPLRPSVKNARIRPEGNGEFEMRRAKNELLALISATHFSNAVKIFNEEKVKELKQYEGKSLLDLAREFKGGASTRGNLLGKLVSNEDEGSELNYLIGLFSNSINKNLHISSQTAGRCLMKCPVSLSWKFICKVIHQLPDIPDSINYSKDPIPAVLRLGQILSFSHNNFVSFNNSRNSNLASFLWGISTQKGTRTSRMMNVRKNIDFLKYDANRYGNGDGNKCLQFIQSEFQEQQRVYSDSVKLQVGRLEAILNQNEELEHKKLLAATITELQSKEIARAESSSTDSQKKLEALQNKIRILIQFQLEIEKKARENYGSISRN